MTSIMMDLKEAFFDVSTKLMENYRSVVPANGGGPLSVIGTSGGPLIAGISSTGDGFALVQDPMSDSGWRTNPFGPATLNAIAAVLDSADTPHIFASDGSSLLHATQTGTRPLAWSQLTPVPQIQANYGLDVLRNAGQTHVIAVGTSAVSYGVESSHAPDGFQWFENVIALDFPARELQSVRLLPDRNNGVLIAINYSQPVGGRYPPHPPRTFCSIAALPRPGLTSPPRTCLADGR